MKGKRYYTVAGEPYNWIGRPPGPNRLLGVQWLGSVLYPETFTYDMVAKTKEFYSLFYRHELTDEEALALSEKKSESPRQFQCAAPCRLCTYIQRSTYYRYNP